MADKKIQCYALPGQPLPVLLPIECVAEVLSRPNIVVRKDAPVNWMRGQVNWQNQLVPVMSYSALHDAKLDESKERKPVLVVLNPIPNAVRKAYTSIICYGDIQELVIDRKAVYQEIPDNMDRRYVEAVVGIGDDTYVIPKLDALGVAFSYF